MLEDQTVADRDPIFRLAVEAKEQNLVHNRLISERHRRKWNVVAKEIMRGLAGKRSDAALMASIDVAKSLVFFPNPAGKRRLIDEGFVRSILFEALIHLRDDAVNLEICEQMVAQHVKTKSISGQDIADFREVACKRLGLPFFRGKETTSGEVAESQS